MIAHPWHQSARFSRRDWLRFETWLALISALLVCAVATRYLPFVTVSEPHAVLYLALAWLSHFGLLVALLTLPQSMLALVLPSRWVLVPIGVLSLAVMLIYIVVDTEVYARYRFHLNGFVWELLSGPGTGENLPLSGTTVFVMAVAVMMVAALSTIAAWFALSRASSDTPSFRARYFVAAWALAFVTAQCMHIWYEAHYDGEVTGVTRHFPLHHPLTAKRLLVRYGLLDASAARESSLERRSDVGRELIYPQNPMRCESPANPVDVLVIIVDSLRADAFDARIMPRLHSLTERANAQMFTDHISGGNVTRGGIFGLFTGLPATYWNAFAAAHRSAIWIEQHQKAGYRVGIFSSATLQSPAFDRTVFSTVPALRLGSEGDNAIERDLDAISDISDFLAADADSQPYFGVLYLDAAHGPTVPEGAEHFRPQLQRVDHLRLDADFDPLPYVNRYWNALHWLDERVGEFLDAADADGHLDNTLVILTSDHGDEFNDLGLNYWGHGSNFSRYQTQVPLMMLWPGRSQQQIDYRTSHYDVAATVLREVLGCENPPSDHSIGAHLFDASAPRDYVPVVSYYNYGILLEDRTIATYPSGGYEVLGPDGRPLKDQEIPVGIRASLLDMLSRFYR